MTEAELERKGEELFYYAELFHDIYNDRAELYERKTRYIPKKFNKHGQYFTITEICCFHLENKIKDVIHKKAKNHDWGKLAPHKQEIMHHLEYLLDLLDVEDFNG